LKGRYVFPNVQAAQYRRLATITEPGWVDAMVASIERTGDRWFRWHDSGDLQSVEHLARIAEVAERTPEVSHWIPTREYRMVREYLDANGGFPANLTVRLSAHMVDGPAPTGFGLPVSTVHTNGSYPDAHVCPAPKQGGTCGDCRACWDPQTEHVSYAKH
jgi:hypothetical protein